MPSYLAAGRCKPVLLVLFVLPYEIQEKIFEGPPPCFEKSCPPLLKKNLTPSPGLLELAHV